MCGQRTSEKLGKNKYLKHSTVTKSKFQFNNNDANINTDSILLLSIQVFKLDTSLSIQWVVININGKCDEDMQTHIKYLLKLVFRK